MPADSDKPIVLPRQLHIKYLSDTTMLITMERDGAYTSTTQVPRAIGEECMREAMNAIGSVLLRRNWARKR